MASKKMKMKSEKDQHSERNSSSPDGNANGDNAIDRISNLPDHIIAIILSHLPVEQSARTSVLSTHWRRLWLLSSLNIDDESLFKIRTNLSHKKKNSWIIETFTRILSLHPGPVLTCRFTDPFWKKHRQTATRLLESLTQRGIRRLEISTGDCLYDLPPCVLECESLLDLRMGSVTLPYRLPERIFPNLRRLHIVDHYVLSDLLSRCSIADLEFGKGFDHEEVFIESSSLRTLNALDGRFIEKLVIKDTPMLERLIVDEDLTMYCEVVILNAPKLKVFGRVNMMITSLRLGESRFYDTFMFNSFSTRIHSLSTLAIKVNFTFVNQGKSIPYLLRCFPCLETFDVLIDGMEYYSVDNVNSSIAPSYGDYWEKYHEVDCLDRHLKYVQLKGYSGKQSHMDFAIFIISKARVLKKMTLICESKWKEIETEKQLLCLGKRASQDGQVVFVKR